MTECLVEQFLANEATPYVVDTLLAAISDPRNGPRYFTFNAFNVSIDFDGDLATIEDEFDPDVASILPLADLRSLLIELRRATE